MSSRIDRGLVYVTIVFCALLFLLTLCLIRNEDGKKMIQTMSKWFSVWYEDDDVVLNCKKMRSTW